MISLSSTIELQEALRVASGTTLKLVLSRCEGKQEKPVSPSPMAIHPPQEGESLKLAAEAAQVAKAAAAQAFWEAEEARQRRLKEARDAEEARLLEEQRKKRAVEDVQRKLEEGQRKLVEEQRKLEEQQHKLEEEQRRLVQELEEEQRRIEQEQAARAELEAMQREIQRNAEEAAKAKAARVQVFWDEEAARQRAEKDSRAAVEATLLAKTTGAQHNSIQCNTCNVYPIVGTRYQCTICHDFDLCADCEAKPDSHPVNHPLLKHKQPVSTVTVHHGVSCDNCNKSPITGARFKCKLCPNFDLCEECESKDVHPADHPLFKFRLERQGGRMGGMGCRGRGGFKGFLQRESFGPRVRKLQERLGVEVDGFYGEKTEEAVKEFQTKQGLVADGIVGPLTKQKLRLVFGKGKGSWFDVLMQKHLP